jgi:DinB superfamily
MLCATGKFIRLASRAHAVQPLELHAASLTIDGGAVRLCAGLTEDQLSWSPNPGRWSIAENLAHIRAVTEVFLPAVDAALAATRNLNLRSTGPFTLSLYGRVIVWHMESRPIFKLQAPKAIQPRLLDSPASELQEFLHSQSALRRRIAAAEDFHLTALRFPSPLAGRFRFNLLEFFSVFNAHARRHLRQAGNVRRALPSSLS